MTLELVSGDAVLGAGRQATVTIALSDDARGVVGVTEASAVVLVTELAMDRVVCVNVSRVLEGGATLGTTEVSWELDPPLSDYAETSGSVTFGPGDTHRCIDLVVRADNTPELAELTTLRLVTASNGARLAADRTTALITIEANDKPHGELLLLPASSRFLVHPDDATARVVRLSLARLFGLEGALNVTVTLSFTNDGNPLCALAFFFFWLETHASCFSLFLC